MLLFVYAQLEDGETPAAMRGVLRRRANGDGAMQADENAHDVVYGELHRVTLDKLKALDKMEAPEFRRRLGYTTEGLQVWFYQYELPDWADLPRIRSGRY